jgi:hypothetical protein
MTNISNTFTKLNKQITKIEYKKLDSRIKFGETIDGEFKGIEYFNVDNADALFDLLLVEHRSGFCATLMKINRNVPPHTDTGIKVTINLYLKTDDCVTQFYKFKTNNPKVNQVENQTDGFIFDESDLERTHNFMAEDGDVWILDVSQPHSVNCTGKLTERLGLSLATNTYNYDEVCSMLKEMGNL